MNRVLHHARQTLATLATALAAAMILAPGAHAQYPIESGDLAVSDTVVAPGGQVSISGGGFEPGAPVSIIFRSDPVVLDRVAASPQGEIDTTVRIPPQASPGSHTLEARGAAAGGGTLVLRTPVEVSGEPSPGAPEGPGSGFSGDGDSGGTGDDGRAIGETDGGSLPFTGSEALPFAVAGFGLLGCGLLLFFLGRRRPRRG